MPERSRFPANTKRTRTERRLSAAGVIVAAGLLIQILSHLWIHPLAFMSFLIIGTPLVVLGVLLFLLSLIWHDEITLASSE